MFAKHNGLIKMGLHKSSIFLARQSFGNLSAPFFGTVVQASHIFYYNNAQRNKPLPKAMGI